MAPPMADSKQEFRVAIGVCVHGLLFYRRNVKSPLEGHRIFLWRRETKRKFRKSIKDADGLLCLQLD